jgi:predicted glycosyltransferase involved in capsule biosynthesis
MKLGIVIPWRAQPSRIYAFDAVVARYATQFPEAKIYFADKEGERWNMSGSRNLGCEMAIADGCDVMLVSDADIYLDAYVIGHSMKEATERQSVSIPYTKAIYINKDDSLSIIRGDISDISKLRWGNSVDQNQSGGACVITPQVFKKLNGWDERFVGWGFEDSAFRMAHEKLLGAEMHRAEGFIGFLYHKDRDKELVGLNEKLFNEYNSMTTEQMMEHIKGNRV